MTENITIDISPVTRIAYNCENLWDEVEIQLKNNLIFKRHTKLMD